MYYMIYILLCFLTRLEDLKGSVKYGADQFNGGSW